MHDSNNGERVAGWYHLGFAALYIIATIWHIKGTLEHWERI